MKVDPTASVTDETQFDPRLMSIVDEISDRIQQGKSVDVEAYARDLPTYADYLRQLVKTLRDVANLGMTEAHGAGAGSLQQQPKQIGEFKLIRQIGQGGMGLVYEAMQGSLDRRVALKVLRMVGMLDERQLTRFRNEARAAATLHHPHIVPVFSVGSDRGIYFYAMQFIEGPSLAEILHDLQSEQQSPAKIDRQDDDHSNGGSNVSSETRAELQAAISTKRTREPGSYSQKVATWGVQAAEGLAYAHENGVLHRDIKPGNLLVDRSGKLWITDFGLARIEQDASLTMTGDLVGTLRYMSPEQALAKRVLVDHRSDIYSLGITLYEMLTMQPAFGGSDRQELLKQIAFEEPTSPRRIDSSIPVDLETIVLKAAAKNPEERYVSADEMADDLRRYLDDKPIWAKPPTIISRGAKWSRRHRAAIWAAAAVLGLAVVSLAVGAGLLWAEQRRTVAALDEAEEAAAKAQALANFLLDDLFGAASPTTGHGPDVTVKQVLDYAEANMGDAFVDQPLSEAQIRFTLSRVYTRLRDLAAAERNLTRAVDLFTTEHGVEHAVTLSAMNDLTGLLVARRKLFGAARERKEIVQIARRVHGPEDRITLGYMHNLAGSLQDPDEAIQLHKEVLEIRRRVLGAEDPDTLGSMYTLANLLKIQGELDQCLLLHKEVLEIRRRVLGPEHPRTLDSMNSLGIALGRQNKPDEAQRLLKEVFEIRRRTSGPENLGTLFAMANLASTLQVQGKLDEARQLQEEALPMMRRVLGQDNPYTLRLMNSLASTMQAQGEMDEARRLREETLQAFRRVRGPDHPDTLRIMLNMGTQHLEEGKLDEARCSLEEVVRIGRRVFGEKHQKTLDAMENLAIVFHEQGALDKARCQWEEVIAMRWPDRLPTRAYPNELVRLGTRDYLANGLDASTLRLFRRAQEIYEDCLKDPDSYPAAVRELANFLATCPAAEFRDPSRSIELLEPLLKETPEDGDLWGTLGAAHHATGDWEKAIDAFEKANTFHGEGEAWDCFPMAMCLWHLGQQEEARESFEQAVRYMEHDDFSSNPELQLLRRQTARLLIQDEPTPSRYRQSTR